MRLRYRALFTRLGPGFDGDKSATDFDALYCIVEGTASTSVGEAQARALTELVAEAASSWAGGSRRAGLLVLDEFSAVAGRVPVHELTERCRSLGLAVMVRHSRGRVLLRVRRSGRGWRGRRRVGWW